MANKALRKGKWHFITEKGRLGGECPEFVEGVDMLYVEDGAFGDYIARKRPSQSAEPAAVRPAPRPGQKIYKVLTQRDEFFGGKFNPETLEALVNQLAGDGWRVISVATADVSTFMGSFWGGRGARQEMIVFLEKTVE